jgi:hypothetical protein
MGKKFRPLEDSIAMVKKMIEQETRNLNLEMNAYDRDPDVERIANIESALDYWNHRLHGYQKLQNLQRIENERRASLQ